MVKIVTILAPATDVWILSPKIHKEGAKKSLCSSNGLMDEDSKARKSDVEPG